MTGLAKGNGDLMRSICLILLLSMGCAQLSTKVQTSPNDSIDKRTKIHTDSYSKSTVLMSPAIMHADNFIFLVKGKSKHNESIFICQITTITKDWLYIDTVYDSDGHQFKYSKTDSRVRDGLLSEMGYFEIEEKYLRDHQTLGLDFKISGTRGSVISTVSPSQIQEFLSVVDKHKLP